MHPTILIAQQPQDEAAEARMAASHCSLRLTPATTSASPRRCSASSRPTRRLPGPGRGAFARPTSPASLRAAPQFDWRCKGVGVGIAHAR